MSNDIFDYSVPVFLRGHGILAELLKKAESHAAERKIAPAVLLTARLFPDMYPLRPGRCRRRAIPRSGRRLGWSAWRRPVSRITR